MAAWDVPANGTSEYPNAGFRPGEKRPTRVWLETGEDNGETAGYSHIRRRHAADLEAKGISLTEQPARVPLLAEAHTTVGRHVGYASGRRGPGRPVMATYMKDEGKIHQDGLNVGSNGYVVSLNPVDNPHRRPGEPKPVSDRTMKNLYFYPPNQPERRSTHEAQGSQKQAQQPRKQPTL